MAILTYSETPSDERTIFESRLFPVATGTYKTPNGTIFTLKHLPGSVINDGSRHINSGDWQLVASGQSRDVESLTPKMPEVTFGYTPPLVYLGASGE